MMKCVRLFQTCFYKLDKLFYGDDLETIVAEKIRNIKHVRQCLI